MTDDLDLEPAEYDLLVKEVISKAKVLGVPRTEAKLSFDFFLGYNHVRPLSYELVKSLIEEAIEEWQP